jgi:hypothetical protein
MLDDEESIQASLMEVMNALVRNEVDPKRAELLLRALNAAIRNSKRARFGNQPSAMVTEVPDYPLPPRRIGKHHSGSKANPGPEKPDTDVAYEFTDPKMKMYLDDPPKLKPEKTAGVV